MLTALHVAGQVGLAGRSVGLIPRERPSQNDQKNEPEDDHTHEDLCADLGTLAVVFEGILINAGTVEHDITFSYLVATV